MGVRPLRLVQVAVFVVCFAAGVEWMRRHPSNRVALRSIFFAPVRPQGPPLTNAAAPHQLFDPLFENPADAQAMVDLAHSHGKFRQYVQESSSMKFEEDIPVSSSGTCPVGLFPDALGQYCIVLQRFDVGRNVMTTGGVAGRRESIKKLISRLSYFRETLAIAPHGFTAEEAASHPEIVGKFLNHTGFKTAAASLYPGRQIVTPYIAFANVMIPSQALGVHVDVPEFRGMHRKDIPQWLLVAMHLSGLFEQWRLHIATCVSWFHNSPEDGGGAFVYWPDGPHDAMRVHKVKYNTAVCIDTDSVVHGVATVGGNSDTPVQIMPLSSTLQHTGNKTWSLRASGEGISTHSWDTMRYSVSWKAYCFKDEEEVSMWKDGRDPMTYDRAVRMLVKDLQSDGHLSKVADIGQPLEELTGVSRLELAHLIVFRYILFPRKESILERLTEFNYCVLLEFLPKAVSSFLEKHVC